MKKLLAVAAMVWIAGGPAWADETTEQSAAVNAQSLTPAVAKIVDFAKASGMKTLAYFELDDSVGNPGTISLTILSQTHGNAQLFILNNEKTAEFLPGLASEASASGKNGWRTVAIVIDKDAVTVERGPSPGPISGISARLRAEADRVFPGHT